MFAAIFFLPLLVFIFLTLFSDIRPKYLLAVTVPAYVYNILAITTLLVVTCFLNYSGKYIYVYQFFNWSTLEGVDVGFTIWLDYVAVIMTFTVLLVASMVNLFSIYYMANDPFIVRFFAYLSLFTFCMLLLVIAADLVQFFIGWELVGLCSYLLINFWYTRKQANIAAMKAVLVNRVGDFAFMYSMSLLFVKFNSLNIQEISWLVLLEDQVFFDTKIIVVLLFIAVMSKSAQFGLHTWLPDAMEGPTPVSALIHAATMVTAGIFLMLRLSNLFIVEKEIMSLIALVGAFTAFFGATTGSVQTDIKKIIAFSTCSQLGYMVAACGLGNFAIAFFHLVTHAFFKSLLFLCAGIVIHTLNGEQDIRKMGFLAKALPSAFISMTIASMALAGIPYLGGFYSKELIISLAYTLGIFTGNFVPTIVFVLLLKAAVFTSFYSAKLIYHIFLKKPAIKRNSLKTIHVDGGDFLTTQIPLIVLSFFSVFGGLIFKDIIVGLGYNITLNTFSEFIYEGNLNNYIEYTPIEIKALLLIISLSGFIFYIGLFVTNIVFKKNIKLNIRNAQIMKLNRELTTFLYHRWYFDSIISYFFNRVLLLGSDDLNVTVLQNKIVDGLTVNLVTKIVKEINAATSVNSQNTLTYIKNTYISLMLTVFLAFLTKDTLVFYIF